MVDDFNEFSAIVTNPVERLHLKQFVKTYSSSIDPPSAASIKDIQDDLGKNHDQVTLYITTYTYVMMLMHVWYILIACTLNNLLHNLHLEHLVL